MTRERKTLDEYHMLIDYVQGEGWEHELTAHCWQEAAENRREYRENCPQYPTRTRKCRVPKSTYDAAELAEVERRIRQARERWRQRIKRKLESPRG